MVGSRRPRVAWAAHGHFRVRRLLLARWPLPGPADLVEEPGTLGVKGRVLDEEPPVDGVGRPALQVLDGRQHQHLRRRRRGAAARPGREGGQHQQRQTLNLKKKKTIAPAQAHHPRALPPASKTRDSLTTLEGVPSLRGRPTPKISFMGTLRRPTKSAVRASREYPVLTGNTQVNENKSQGS